jgi:uncharacterized repeat protein (TIGR03803 family)
VWATDTLTTLHAFTGTGGEGARPYAGLVQGTNGDFFGTTLRGGEYGSGTVFSVSAAGTFTTIYSFRGPDGANPRGGVIQGIDGFFYGTTSGGGTHNSGTVFKVDTAGAFTPLYDFSGGVDGGSPQAAIVQGSDSNYYGLTSSGGAFGDGTMFMITPSGAFNLEHSFRGSSDGANPQVALVQGSDGFLYGTAYGGGTHNSGTIFKIDTTGALTTLYDFMGGLDGANPAAGLVEGSDSNFYGTTFNGGVGFGTVFRVTSDGVLTVLWEFDGKAYGGRAQAGLILGDDGNFYGTTTAGGTSKSGTVFKITSSGKLTTLYNFTGYNDGAVPQTRLLQVSATNFLGTTSTGGAEFLGTIFNLTQPCTFSLSPSRVILNGLANTGTVAITPSGTGCVWTATSDVDWITVTSSNSGIGEGMVAYAVTVNSNNHSRTGRVMIGGQRFTVTQQPAALGAFLLGSYDGLIMITNAPSQNSSGSMSLVLGKAGSFAAKLTLDGVQSSFKGQFDPSGNSTNTVTRKNLGPLTVILQAAAASNTTDQIVGTVSDGTFTAQVLANLAVFSTANPSSWVGEFTLTLPPANIADTTVPQGYGYATLDVSRAGNGSLRGVLGDGTKISGKFPVSGYGTWPLYNSLYKDGGFCIGWVTFGEENTLSGTVHWVKEPSSSQFYPNGFTNTLSLTGDVYTPPAKGGRSVAATGQLTLGGGNLTSNIVIAASIAGNGTGTASPAGSGGLKLKVVPATGQMSGSFLDPTVNKAVKFNGLVLQSSGTASGYFLGTSESGFVTFTPDSP